MYMNLPFELNYFNLTLLIGAFVSFFSASLILYQKSKRLANRMWFWLNVFVTVWSSGYAVMITTTSFEVATKANHILHCVAIFIPVLFLHFVSAITKKFEEFKTRIRLLYAVAFIFVAINPTDLLLTSVKSKFIFKFVSDAGPLFIYYTLFFVVVVLTSEYVLFRAMIQAKGLYRSQLRYIFFATVIGFAGGSSVFFLTLNINFPPYPMILYSLYPIVVTYSIIKYRSFDIRSMVFRSVGFSFLVFVTTSILAFLTSLIVMLIGIQSVFWISVIMSVFVSIGYKPLRTFIETKTKNFLYKKTYNPDIVLEEITEETSSLQNLKQLLDSIGSIITDAIGTDKISFVLIGEDKKITIPYEAGFPFGVSKKILNNKEVLKILYHKFVEKQSMLVIEEMKILYDNGDYSPSSPELLNDLYNNDVGIVVPLKEKDMLRGVIAIGNKKSGDPFTEVDLRMIGIASGQIAISIKNALLYEEQKQFNTTLKKKVEEATFDLRKANKRLKELDESKSEFLSIAAHQLRTPITGIKGYISMILEGDYGKLTSAQRFELERIYRSSDRLTRLINVFLNVSRIETGRLDLTKTKENIVDIVEGVVSDLKPQSDKKNLKVSIEYPEEKIPNMLIDKDKIHDVVMNLVDNAIKYTEKGWVSIRLSSSKSLMTFESRDSGIGISEEEIDKLFQKFSRAEAVDRVHTGGSGLGLFIAKKIIEAHGGKIWAESDGKNKGSVFTFTLPIE